jgi:hypothetical protein
MDREERDRILQEAYDTLERVEGYQRPEPNVPVESKTDRWMREADEQTAREAEADAQRLALEQAGIRQAHQDAVELAEAARQDDQVTLATLRGLNTCLETLARLEDRLERVEAALKQNTKAAEQIVELPQFLPRRVQAVN